MPNETNEATPDEAAAFMERMDDVQGRCDAATPPPWHYYPCGEKSNDCILGAAWGKDGSPPPGEVDLHPFDEEKNEFENHKYVLDPEIASAINDANYTDFAFMAHARTDLPAALATIRTLQQVVREYVENHDTLVAASGAIGKCNCRICTRARPLIGESDGE